MKTYLKPSIEITDLYPEVSIAAYGNELIGDAEGAWGDLSMPNGTRMFEPYE